MISKPMIAYGSARSYIRELFEFGRSRAAKVGEDAICDFSLGNPSVPAPTLINKEIIRLAQQMPSKALHGYTSSAGDAGTRDAIAEDLNLRFGTNYSAKNLYLVNGAATALTTCFKALTIDAQTEFIAIAPYFLEYGVFTDISGAKMREVSPDIPNFQIRFEELSEKINGHTQGVIINSPNNPSGSVLTEETIRRLADLLTEKSRQYQHPIYIICDEPYRELVYDGVKVPFVPNYYPDTLVCYSYSKSLSLPGERIGYILVPDNMTDGRESVFFAIAGAARALGAVCAPSLMQYVIRECAHQHIMPNLRPYEENRAALCSALKEMGYSYCNPAGTFYLFIQAPNGDSMAFSEMAKEQDVLIVPGDVFGCPGYLRISYCVDSETIKRALPRFRLLMDACREQKTC